MAEKRVLVLFAHPLYERSRVNRSLLEAVRDVPGVTVHDLYETYPHLDVDVRREQALLASHDVFVFQHPFYWYSTPALVKQWLDLVLEHGWAYGSKGTALAGKIALNALTTGGTEAMYRPGGSNRFSVRQLLAPFEQSMRLCGMTYLGPFTVHDSLRLSGRAPAEHGARYRELLVALRDDRIDLAVAADAEVLSRSVPGLFQ